MSDTPRTEALRTKFLSDGINMAELLESVEDLERELNQARIELKNLAPIGKYNGLGIEEWYQRAEAAESKLASLTALVDKYEQECQTKDKKTEKLFHDYEAVTQELEQLRAGYAGAVGLLKKYRELTKGASPNDWHAFYEATAEALSSTPQSVKDVMDVLDAADKLINPPITSATYMVKHGTVQVCGPDLEALRIAVRKLEGK